MSRVKAMPDDVKQSCISLVKGYARRKMEYNLRRQELIHKTPNNHVTVYWDPSDPYNTNRQIGAVIPSGHNASRTTENIAEQIQALEKRPETRRMRAVEYAAERVGLDLGEKDRQHLKNAIFKSCIDGRKYPFERLGIDNMERSCFYDRRRKFLYDIAIFMDLI